MIVHDNCQKIDTKFTAISQVSKELTMKINEKSKLSQLENKINLLHGNGKFSDSRTAFEIGINLGRELQKYNIENYECILWGKRDLVNESQTTKTNEIEKINQVFRSLILKSINNKIDEIGSWSISNRDINIQWSNFSNETVRKYHLQYEGSASKSYDHFECSFRATGKLQELLNLYDIGLKINASVTNPSGDSHLVVDCKIFISKNLYDVNSCLEYKTDWPLEKFKEFNEALVKLFLFELLK